MSVNCGSEGAFSALAIDEVGATFDADSERYEFLAENIGLREGIVKGLGLTGELDTLSSHLRPGAGYVAGNLMMNISPKEFDLWIPRFLGGTETSNVHSMGSTFPAFDMLIKRDKGTFKYSNCYVTQAMIECETKINSEGDDEPQLIKLTMAILGFDESSGQTWPDPGPDIDLQNKLYWLSGDSTLTLNSTAYPFDWFRLVINNMMRPRLRNNLRPVCIESHGRSVLIDTLIPHSATAHSNLYNTRLNGAGSLSFASSKYLGNSDSSTIFTLAKLYQEKQTPQTRGRTETHLPLRLHASKNDNSTDVLTITNTFPADA